MPVSYTHLLTACFAMAGMKVELSGGYSGWQPNVDSPILHAMKLSYKPVSYTHLILWQKN